jgi:hypothetical protein
MGWRPMSLPSSSMTPSSGRIMPTVMRKEVVFPAPFGPSSPMISPDLTSKLTPSTTARRR